MHPPKGAPANMSDTIWYRNRLQSSTPLEGTIVNPPHGTGYNNMRYFLTLYELDVNRLIGASDKYIELVMSPG